jgi:quaternary ammonium compound-resistance protein SugE
MAWLYLVLAGVADIIWTSLLKTHGFSRPLYTALVVGVVLFVPLFIGLALKTLPLGTAYAVWMGVAVIGAFIAGVVFFQEPVTAARILCVGLILAGIIGLKFLEGGSPGA